jgi:hypothetical protein
MLQIDGETQYLATLSVVGMSGVCMKPEPTNVVDAMAEAFDRAAP